MKKYWNKWKVISNKLLDKEATIVLTILYIILVAPFATIYKIFSDPLNIKLDRWSFWFKKETSEIPDIESLKKQY
jgi:hypothetical protein